MDLLVARFVSIGTGKLFLFLFLLSIRNVVRGIFQPYEYLQYLKTAQGKYDESIFVKLLAFMPLTVAKKKSIAYCIMKQTKKKASTYFRIYLLFHDIFSLYGF